MIGYVGRCRLMKFGEEFQPSVMMDRELKKGKEFLVNPFNCGVSPYGIVHVSFGCRSHEGSLKKSQMIGILGNVFQGTTYVECHETISGILPYTPLKFGNI